MIADRRVVVTGKIAGETRDTAEAKLRAAGAIVQPKITKDTDLLIAGDGVGQTKINAAAKHNVRMVSWYDAFRNSGDASATTAASAPRAAIPDVRQWGPMLCKAGELPTGDGWLYEIKFDGIRGIVTVRNGNVSIQSRSGLSDLTNRYPDVTEELALLPNCVVDGELVQMGDDLGLLANGCDPNPVARFIAWDILEDDGEDVTVLPLRQRRELLERRVVGGCYVAASPVFDDGQQLLDFVAEHGLEGIVAKRGNSNYQEGSRRDWVKVKVRLQQEFVIAGFTPGDGARASTIGALVLAYFDENHSLVYCGKVGTGFDTACLSDLVSRIREVSKTTELPLRAEVGDNRDVTWLEPVLVAEVKFQKWTDDQVIYHSSFVRVRDDKAAWEVVRET